MNFLRTLYTVYGFLIFCLSFLILFPLILLSIWIPDMKKYGRKINRFWANLYFLLIFKPIKIEGKAYVKKDQAYIFVANHFSYLDIAMMGFVPGDVVFVGKSSLGKIPLFGYYFKKLHIAVNRSSARSRAEVLLRSKNVLENGSSLVIFPEGGMITQNPPFMSHFKDGAFTLALEKQIPIIPVTLSYNHLILPDQKSIRLHFKRGKMTFHPAVSTQGLGKESLQDIKRHCFDTIQAQLLKDNGMNI
ncbi:lysophospholipid acyltransferase family protein [Belliella kenyensis]|uniref:Lysophospholipid acyltransferase family protein n=1 Tax=Belliella kenyensis TaxID=1472724 RepID=A0ABV8ERI6_9BACT|nr:lysophospholipid acyltransferase family protein [Belliella kenyensis]MCH7402077.1 1-acyl-sn-glycerol-3-phosphate acyltransferase [Belliella kenyensis]MDN3601518.1 lysophospholipid acyltransferase family protein [Belliella kenyensis]MDN3605241.1 lysophospholipid acyltransferase family protein [Belliella kenyensis]